MRKLGTAVAIGHLMACTATATDGARAGAADNVLGNGIAPSGETFNWSIWRQGEPQTGTLSIEAQTPGSSQPITTQVWSDTQNGYST